MTPAEFKEARLRLGLTQSELARALKLGGDGKRTVRRWEHGERDIPGPAQVAVRLMLAQSEATR